MSAEPPIAEIVQSFIEPIFWATFIAVGLTGCSFVQVVRWAGTSFSSDSIWIKLFLLAILALNVSKTVCDVLGLHTVLLVDFGKLAALPPTFHGALITAMSVIWLCQGWQFYRTLIVSRRNLVVVVIGGLLLAASLASSILFIIGSYKSHNISQTSTILHLWYPLSTRLKFITDLFFSAAFTVFVLREERKALNARLSFMLRRVAVTTLQAFFPCTLLQLACAIAGQTNPDSTLFGALIIVLSPLYTVCVLYTLNSREAISHAGDRIQENESCYPTEFCSVNVFAPTSSRGSVGVVPGSGGEVDAHRLALGGRGRKMSLQESLASV